MMAAVAAVMWVVLVSLEDARTEWPLYAFLAAWLAGGAIIGGVAHLLGRRWKTEDDDPEPPWGV